jgi:hypothetical protein
MGHNLPNFVIFNTNRGDFNLLLWATARQTRARATWFPICTRGGRMPLKSKESGEQAGQVFGKHFVLFNLGGLYNAESYLQDRPQNVPVEHISQMFRRKLDA